MNEKETILMRQDQKFGGQVSTEGEHTIARSAKVIVLHQNRTSQLPIFF